MDETKDIYHIEIPQVFEGPLDLLLHLIRKHELDIFNIPIAFLTERYLEYLDLLREINLDVASEFLEMAATLTHIKSRMLLPKPPPDEETGEEEGDPREDLVRRLLEYQKYKDAAEQFAGMPLLGRDTFVRSAFEKQEVGPPELRPAGLFDLLDALQKVLTRAKTLKAHEITRHRITLADRMNQLATLLSVKKRAAFEDLFEDQATTFDIAITFLSLLEMTRIHVIRLYQSAEGGTIHVWLAAQDEPQEEGKGEKPS